MTLKQTVKIFLAEGNPTGLRVLELFNWNGRGIIIPRDRVEFALSREDLGVQGVYLLIGEAEDGRQMLYIGESENLKDRIRTHNKTKDFWDTAICFFSKDGNLNKAHVKYLEELLIAESLEAGRMQIENGNQPTRTRLAESDEAEILIFAENIKLILSSVGFTFLKKPTEYEEEKGEVYVCKGPDADAKALYTSEGIVMLPGSLVRKDFVQSVRANAPFRRKQQELIDSGVLELEGNNQLQFVKEYIFSSPSTSAAIVLARNANGWIEWARESDGKTLDEVYRQ